MKHSDDWPLEYYFKVDIVNLQLNGIYSKFFQNVLWNFESWALSSQNNFFHNNVFENHNSCFLITADVLQHLLIYIGEDLVYINSNRVRSQK